MKVFFYSILIFLFSITLYSQDKPSLIENSLRMVDLQPYSGKIEPQKIRLGIYLNEVKIENPPQGFPADLKGYVIWHIMPHWTADEAGYYIGDTLIGLEGKPLYDSVDRGDNYLELYLRNKKEGDIIKLTGLKNGKVLEKKVKLIGIRYVDMPCIDPGIGSVRSSWLAEEINKHGLDDWTLEIRKQMATCANSDFCTVPFAGRYNPWRLNAVTYLHRNPTRLSAYSGIIVNDIWEGIEFEHGLVGAVKAAAKHLDIPDVNFPLPELPTSPEDFEEFFAKVQNELDIAYNPVKNDLDSIVKELMSLLKMEGGWEEGLDTLKNEAEKRKIRLIKEKELAELFGKADKVDLFALVAAAKMLAAMIEPAWVNEFSKNIFELLKDSVNNDRIELKKNDETIYWETSYGKCAIGGSGHNFYKGDYCLIIDLSGDDVYELPPVLPGTFRIVIDVEGNDTYINKEYGQAAGLGCIDILFDMKGNDTYRSSYYSQGAGLLGIGILADFFGDDIYDARYCSQGAAFLGIGLLYDMKGMDSYNSWIYSQGFGYIKGFGAIIEHEGNDTYRAGWKYTDSRDPKRAHLSLSQGFGYGMRPWATGIGADGGIGLITDYSGHDVYNADFFSQGGSYWYALGILHDRSGCDRYTAGQYSQGSGIHLSFGALLDDEGNDMYDAYAGLEQGNAHDWSSGCLEDWEGDDTYRGHTSSQGSALTVAYAWLLDSQGDDIYVIKNTDTTYSEGGGRQQKTRQAGSFGILMDLGCGDDTYTEPRAVEGTIILKGEKGFLYDDGKKKK